MFVNDKVLDQGIKYVADNATDMVFCIGDPGSSYADAIGVFGTGSNKRAGLFPTPNIGAPGDRAPNGREIALPPQVGNNGDLNSNPNAVTHYAILNATLSEVLVSHTLVSPITVTTVDPVELTAILRIGIPAAT